MNTHAIILIMIFIVHHHFPSIFRFFSLFVKCKGYYNEVSPGDESTLDYEEVHYVRN